MRRMCFLLACLLALTGTSSAESLAKGQRADERIATKAEIERAAVGQRFRSGLYYGRDGKFSFKSGMLGAYRIQEGSVCVTFASGNGRCDKVYTDGKTFVLIDKRGKRYPFR